MFRTYTNEDMREILQRAEALKQEGISREELIQIGKEVGIGEEILQSACEKWLKEREEGKNQSMGGTNYRQLGWKLHVIP